MGPSAAILRREPLTKADIAAVRAEIAALADRTNGDEFWLDGCPLLVSFCEDYPGALEDEAEGGLATLLGWAAQGTLGLVAMCNGDLDHRRLAQLCARFARKLDGIIDFGGRLSLGPNLDGPGPAEPVRVERPSGCDGILFATSYLTANGGYATCHFGDVAFVDSWLRHPQFCMVK